jgi:DNA (cytosine-5)-methyltransferase 1
VLDAQYFGVAQRRRRVFVVGCLGDAASAAAVLLERRSLQGDFAPNREEGEKVAGTITRSSFAGGAGGKADGAAVNHFVPDVAKTLTTRTGGCYDPDMETMPVIIYPRRLTPIECERLQGFKDNFTRIPWRNKQEDDCPDSPRYKALGNSMAVPVMRWIGERIMKVEGNYNG